MTRSFAPDQYVLIVNLIYNLSVPASIYTYQVRRCRVPYCNRQGMEQVDTYVYALAVWERLVSRAGIEPATLCLKGRCSTY